MTTFIRLPVSPSNLVFSEDSIAQAFVGLLLIGLLAPPVAGSTGISCLMAGCPPLRDSFVGSASAFFAVAALARLATSFQDSDAVTEPPTFSLV